MREILSALQRIQSTLDAHGAMLTSHGKTLDAQARLLDAQWNVVSGLRGINFTLDHHNKLLNILQQDSHLIRDALRELVAPFADPRVGYVCGEVRLVNDSGTNQEGVYWRYEMALRELESRVRSVTGGNGAIYATRREAYLVVDPIMGHDLSFPFNMVKRG